MARAAILDELRQEVEAIREKHGTVPGLVTILVGENRFISYDSKVNGVVARLVFGTTSRGRQRQR